MSTQTWHDRLIDAARPHLQAKFSMPVFLHLDGSVEADDKGLYYLRDQSSRRAVHQANRREGKGQTLQAVYIVHNDGERLMVFSSAARDERVGGRWRTVPTWFEDGPLHVVRVSHFEPFLRPRLSALAG